MSGFPGFRDFPNLVRGPETSLFRTFFAPQIWALQQEMVVERARVHTPPIIAPSGPKWPKRSPKLNFHPPKTLSRASDFDNFLTNFWQIWPPQMSLWGHRNLNILSISDNFLTLPSRLWDYSGTWIIDFDLSFLWLSGLNYVCKNDDTIRRRAWLFSKLTYVTNFWKRTKSSIRQKVVI